MERHIRKIVLYKARHIDEMKKELYKLEQAKKNIIDESPRPQDRFTAWQG